MFRINQDIWKVKFVNHNNFRLRGALAVTDNHTKTIYISKLVDNILLKQVICHEIVHCICFSYGIYVGLVDEEWVANYVSKYGEEIIKLTNDVVESVNR